MCAALALAGCGSSSISAAQLRNRAAQVCATANHETAAIPTPHSPGASVAFLARGLAVLKPELAQLRVLSVPEKLGPVYGVSLNAFAGEVQALASAIRRLRAGADPHATIAALAHRLEPLQSEENGAWRALEIPACVSE